MDLPSSSPNPQSVHPSAQRLCAAVTACFEPVFEPEAFKYQSSIPNLLQIYCSKWGDLGQLVCGEIQAGNINLLFSPPSPISPDELPKYESLLREEVLGLRGRLADLLGQDDVFQAILSQALYEKRLQRQQEFKVWLFKRLRIFGYRDQYPYLNSNNSNKIDEQFDFPIKGTPAQFGVMLRQFALNLRAQSQYQQLVSQILLPGSRKDAGSIPADVNPVEVKLTLARNQLTIHAHVLPVERTLLRVRLHGERTLWELWDAIRDELEKLGWFSLPELPEIPNPVETKPEPQPQAVNPAADIWLSIPDIGANREILRHWHKGLTCEQIGTRVSLSEKTVTNRIHQLRKEFGNQVVPYRKSNYIKNPREKPS